VVFSHGVVLTTVLAALLSVLAAVMRTDARVIRRRWRRRARADRPALRSLDGGIHRGVPAERRLPSLEQAAAELHRLHRQRTNGSTGGSEKWLTAVVHAYDEWLQVACHRLAITHHLAKLDGMDRDIERVRLEGELSAAGIKLPSGRPQQ
jgi:hypothetical protein